jgi:mannose/cellobiose epimerase-like protein (N-acyl-D-glucosamine 2-epimerase family)
MRLLEPTKNFQDNIIYFRCCHSCRWFYIHPEGGTWHCKREPEDEWYHDVGDSGFYHSVCDCFKRNSDYK